MNIAARLMARGHSDRIAILAGDVELTYGRLRHLVDRAAQLLIDQGGRPHDRVIILSENSPFFVVGYLATIRAGLVAVPLQTDASQETCGRIVQDVGARFILVSRRQGAQMSRLASLIDAAIVTDSEVMDTGMEVPAGSFDEIAPQHDLAALMFTSGSTGTPKGVMVTHRNIECNTDDIVQYLELTSDDRAMVVLPFYYCFGLSLLHTHLAVGGSIVISNQFVYPERVLAEMQDRECTGFAGVASTYNILLRNSRFRQLAFPKLRWLQQAGGKLANACIEEICAAFPQVRSYPMYGQTEATARLSYLPPDRLRDKLGSIGKGLPSTRLEVVRPDGSPIGRGATEVGEIVAEGDNVALGYWRDPEETARYFRAGRLHTGDIARVDRDGFIYIVGRERDLIKCGGHRVSARGVEDVIAGLPGVVDVAVIGAPHDILGEAIVAFVVAAAGRTRDLRVVEHCRRHLPGYKMPAAVMYVGDLPRSGSGKVLKAFLKAQAANILRDAPAPPARTRRSWRRSGSSARTTYRNLRCRVRTRSCRRGSPPEPREAARRGQGLS